jgi:hypothetical protein
MRAKRKPINEIDPEFNAGGLSKIRLTHPEEVSSEVEILGHGPDAAGKVVEIMEGLGLI